MNRTNVRSQAQELQLPIEKFEHRSSAAVYENYEEYVYSGAAGFAMSLGHRALDLGVEARFNRRILEIGGAVKPHFSWMRRQEIESYVISDTTPLLEKLGQRPDLPAWTHVHHFDEDPGLATLEGDFTRILASHVLEHIPNPEEAILRWCGLLAPDGLLSIALPCDPGWAWRAGQLVTMRKAMRLNGITKREKDLIMAREHVNAPQRLLAILRYYFESPRVLWLPALVPVVDLNLICVVQAHRADFRKGS